MHESSPRTESAGAAPSRPMDAIQECLRIWETSGFPRPASWGVDVYFLELAMLRDDLAADARRVAGRYAELRFGDAFDDTRLEEAESEVFAATARLMDAATRITADGSLIELRERWRARLEYFAAPAVATPLPAPPRENVVSLPSAPSRPPRKASVAGVRLRGRLATRVRLRQALVACLVGASVAAAGGFHLRDALDRAMSTADVEPRAADRSLGIELSSPPIHVGWELCNEGMPRVSLDQEPRSEARDAVVVESWLRLAQTYFRLNYLDRTETIYSYLARTRPHDAEPARQYARFLLDVNDYRRRDPERALQYAQTAFRLNSGSDLVIETLLDALYEAGHVAQAAELHQAHLDGERPYLDPRDDLDPKELRAIAATSRTL